MSTANISIFRRDGADIRVVLVDGEPWWVAADVTKALGFVNGRMAISRLDQDGVSLADVIDTMGRTQSATILDESALYELIIRSDKPDAKEFRRWVTRDVLPSIRKTGTYAAAAAEPDLALPHDYLSALEALIERERANVALTLENQELAPRATAWDALASAEGDFSVADAAKTISRNGHAIGSQRLFEFMHQINWVFRGADTKWRCYQHAVDKGYIATKLQFHYHPATGERVVDVPQIRVTAKGVNRLSQRLAGRHLEAVVSA
ncbi:phage antirepressor KilAC domain-containing protein [Subtercola endophyticus]|nr:phage antirepressor KilAC domain-containing protein [Subtercola endophyticus]